MTTRLMIAALLLAGSLCGLAPATAQQPEACPADATCYEGHELAFDAADGPVQFLVVATTVRTVTTLDGQTTNETATLVEFISNGDGGFDQRGEPLPSYPRTGALATANVGDTFALTEIGGE